MGTRQAPARTPARASRGGFGVGMVVGLLVGLAVALVVALWVTKAPIPFVNKLPQRGADQDAAEAERNKNWDPNAPLAGKSQARPAAPGAASPAEAPTAASTEPAPQSNPVAAMPAPPAPAAQRTGRDPAAILSGQAEPAARSGVVSGAVPAAPTARNPVPAQVGMAPALNPAATGPSLQFYVQAGAYSRPDDADAQRARVAMLGMAARVMAREQAGRTVYRVRVGPFDDRNSAEDSQSRLTASGIEASLVRVER